MVDTDGIASCTIETGADEAHTSDFMNIASTMRRERRLGQLAAT